MMRNLGGLFFSTEKSILNKIHFVQEL